MEWLSERYGKENMANAMLHLEEQAPHIHAKVVPVDAVSKLNCWAISAYQQKMRDMQTSYAAQLTPLGLQHGVGDRLSTRK